MYHWITHWAGQTSLNSFPLRNTWTPENLGMILDQPFLATKLSAHWMLITGTSSTLFNFQQMIKIDRELGKIVSNYNLETYRVIKITNSSADWILDHLYHYCGKKICTGRILTMDIQGHKWLRWNHIMKINIWISFLYIFDLKFTTTSIANQLPLFNDWLNILLWPKPLKSCLYVTPYRVHFTQLPGSQIKT